MAGRVSTAKHAAGVNEALFKALSHPLRGRILVLLTERVASPKELSEQLEEDLGTVARHCRELRKVGLIEEVDSSNRRGSTEHFYKAVARPLINLETWESLSQIIRELNSAWVAQIIIGDLVEAIEAGTFDKRYGRAMIRVPGVVDQKGFEELEPLALKYYDGVLNVLAKSSERCSQLQDKGINICVTTLAFEVPPPPPGTKREVIHE